MTYTRTRPYTRPYTRPCAVCGTLLEPYTETRSSPHYPATLTAHEFKCYKHHPDRVPDYHKARFERELLGERRSAAAFRGVQTRYLRQGKRAPKRPPTRDQLERGQ